VAISELKRLQIIAVVCDGHSPTDTSARLGVVAMHVMAVAADQSQRFYSCVGIFMIGGTGIISAPLIPMGATTHDPQGFTLNGRF
jgi:hypothetical protein